MTTTDRPASCGCSPTTSRTTCARPCARVLEKHCPPELVTACYDGDDGASAPALVGPRRDLGLAGAARARGARRRGRVRSRGRGRGGGDRPRRVAPVPFLTSAVAATAALAGLGGDAAGDLLGRLAPGDETAALLLPATARSVAGHGLDADGRPLSGTVRNVVGVGGGVRADVLLVPVRSGDGSRCTPYRLPTPRVTIDGRGVARHDPAAGRRHPRRRRPGPRCSAEDAAAARRPRPARRRGPARRRTGRRGRLVPRDDRRLPKERTAVRSCGRRLPGAQAPAGRPVRRGRVRPRGRPLRRRAPWRPTTPTSPVAVALARRTAPTWPCTRPRRRVQLHGGIGMTWEHPAHLVPQARQGRPAAPRHPRAAPRRPGRAGRPPARLSLAGFRM